MNGTTRSSFLSSPYSSEKRAALEPRRKLFKNVVYHIVKDGPLDEEEYNILSNLLQKGDAVETEYTKEGSRNVLDLSNLTHIISNTIDFPEYPDAEQRMINVVKPLWVYKSVNHGRTAPLRLYSPNPKFFFSDVNIFVAGLPQGDREALYGGVRALGGQWSESLTRFTTHVIALSMDEASCKTVALERKACKIVLPHWIDDCLKLHRRIDEGPYLLPNPKILADANSWKPMVGAKMDHTFIHSAYINDKMNPPQPRNSIFQEKRFYIGSDLHLSERSSNTIRVIIESAGGSVVDSLNDANVYVGCYRAEDDYVKACRMRMFVGNLTWLYWMFAHDEWASPLKHLLHYPIPKEKIKGMENYLICISGYNGDSRHYLEKLIEACGATYTKALKTTNTHLITAKPSGEKYTAARDWNCDVVNHLWLEETYAKWHVQSVTLPRYSHFPRMTNLVEVIGQTRLDMHELKSFYASEDDDDSDPSGDDSDREEFSSAKESISASKDVDGRRFAQISQNYVSKAETMTTDSGEHEKHTVSKDAKENASAQPTVRSLSGRTVETPTRPSTKSKSLPSAVSAIDSPASVTSSGGRRAKEKAAVKLKDDMIDLNDFEKQRKRGNLPLLPNEGKFPLDVPAASRKRKGDTVEPEDAAASKKKGKVATKDVAMKVMLTGYTGTVTPSELQRLYNLGIEIVELPDTATHVASPKISRTEKFLCALPRAPVVISTDFITRCLKENKKLDVNDYLLHDPEGEERNKCVLAESLKRAKERKAGLFHNMAINVTPGIKGGYDVIRHIIEANGGQCNLIRNARAKKYIVLAKHPMILISSTEEVGYFDNFLKHAEDDSRDACIFSTEWILTGVLRMEVKFDNEFSLLTEE
ncbi:BRCT domain-containing protein [Lipomyces starkeyi]